MLIENIIMFLLGFICILYPKEITSILAQIELFFWNILIQDSKNKLNDYILNKNPYYLKILGFILIFSAIIITLLKIYYSVQ